MAYLDKSTNAQAVYLIDQDGNLNGGQKPVSTIVSTALSGTIAASGATVAIPFVNNASQQIINPSTGVLWASWSVPAVNGAGSFPIASGGSYSADRTAGTLTLLSTAASQTYTVHRFTQTGIVS